MFQVEWLQSALDELTAMWVAADSPLRQAITFATEQLDSRLRLDPFAESESRPSNRRVLFCSPLGITFRVEAASKAVTVLRVWLFKKRSKPSS